MVVLARKVLHLLGNTDIGEVIRCISAAIVAIIFGIIFLADDTVSLDYIPAPVFFWMLRMGAFATYILVLITSAQQYVRTPSMRDIYEIQMGNAILGLLIGAVVGFIAATVIFVAGKEVQRLAFFAPTILATALGGFTGAMSPVKGGQSQLSTMEKRKKYALQFCAACRQSYAVGY